MIIRKHFRVNPKSRLFELLSTHFSLHAEMRYNPWEKKTNIRREKIAQQAIDLAHKHISKLDHDFKTWIVYQKGSNDITDVISKKHQKYEVHEILQGEIDRNW